jgi:RHS repeat-associated protein
MKADTPKVRTPKNSRTMESTYHYDGLTLRAYKFTGKERDTESNLDEFGARYYASTMGRFMTPDEPLEDQLTRNPLLPRAPLNRYGLGRKQNAKLRCLRADDRMQVHTWHDAGDARPTD